MKENFNVQCAKQHLSGNPVVYFIKKRNIKQTQNIFPGKSSHMGFLANSFRSIRGVQFGKLIKKLGFIDAS